MNNKIRVICGNKKYEGKHVAFADFNSKKVIASGSSHKVVYEKAIKKGFQTPVLCFIPQKKTAVYV